MKYNLLKTKIEPLKQWYCDYCGELIESPEDGMLEWDTNEKLEAKNYRIVHGRWLKTCNVGKDDTHLSDGHLHWFLGDDGLINLLAHYHRYIVNFKEVNEIIRRLHIEYYEEARMYVQYAQEDGLEIDPYSIGDLSRRDMEFLIRKYKDRE